MKSNPTMHAPFRGLLDIGGRAFKPIGQYPAVWQAAISLALFLVIFAATAPLRSAALQLDLNYRLAAPYGVTLLIPPYAPGMESVSSLRSLYSGRPLSDAVSSLGMGSGSLTALLVAVVLIFAMMFIAARLLMLPPTASHIAAWSLPLLLLGGTPFPPFGYFGLPPDIGSAIGAAAGVLAIGFLYRFGVAQRNSHAALYAAGFLVSAIISAGLTPFGAAFAAILLIGGAALAVTARSKLAVARMSIAIAIVLTVFVQSLRGSEPAIRTFIYANPVAEQSFSGILSLLLGRSPASALAFTALLIGGITAGAVCMAWGTGKQRAIGGIATMAVVPLVAVLFLLGFRYPQLRTVDYRMFDAYTWPFLVLAMALALDIGATALADRSAGRPNSTMARVFSFAALLAAAVLVLTFVRQRSGLDEREAFWLNAAETNLWQSASDGAGFDGYIFALTQPGAGDSKDAALYSAPGFRTDPALSALAPRAAAAPLNMNGQALANFARRADNAGSTDARASQLFGLLANWGVTSVVGKPSVPVDAQSNAVTLAAPNISGFSPARATAIAEPGKALAWLAQNGFARRDWVVSDAALPDQLSPARNMRFTRMGSNFRIQAEADGPSLIVLPVGYDPCLMRLVAAGSSSPEDRPRLVLVNLAQAGAFFGRKLDAMIEIGSQNIGSPSCRRAAKAPPPGTDAKGMIWSAPPSLLDLPSPAALTVSAQPADGGNAAIKIVNVSVYPAQDPDVPLPTHPDQHPAYAIDGDGITFWSTGMMPRPRPIYLQLDFDSEKSVDGMTILGRQGYPTLLVAPDLVEVSSDGQAWQPKAMKVSKSEYIVDVALEPATARHLRMRMTQGEYSGSYYDQLSEISVFAKDASTKTLSLSWHSPLGDIAGSTVSGYRIRWSAQPEPGVDCANCRVTGIPLPSAGRFGSVKSAAVSIGMLPKEAQYVSVVGIDVNGKVLAVSNPITVR